MRLDRKEAGSLARFKKPTNGTKRKGEVASNAWIGANQVFTIRDRVSIHCLQQIGILRPGTFSSIVES